jgi:hypothetical protein
VLKIQVENVYLTPALTVLQIQLGHVYLAHESASDPGNSCTFGDKKVLFPKKGFIFLSGLYIFHFSFPAFFRAKGMNNQ